MATCSEGKDLKSENESMAKARSCAGKPVGSVQVRSRTRLVPGNDRRDIMVRSTVSTLNHLWGLMSWIRTMTNVFGRAESRAGKRTGGNKIHFLMSLLMK